MNTSLRIPSPSNDQRQIKKNLGGVCLFHARYSEDVGEEQEGEYAGMRGALDGVRDKGGFGARNKRQLQW